MAMRAALQRGSVGVVVIPGELFLADAPAGPSPTAVRAAKAVVRPDDGALAAAAQVLENADRVTILAGAGCAGAHDELLALAEALKAPVVHAMRGKEFVEYDNPYDVGMTGLIGFSSGCRAMEHCDALVMLGTDFPYRQFYPEGVPVIQVDLRGERVGRRVPVQVPLVGTVKDTVAALLPLITAKTDTAHLDRMTALAGVPAVGWTVSPNPATVTDRCTLSMWPPPLTGSPPPTRFSPPMSVRRVSGRRGTCT
jgi:pyruvate dehydrogenase (quinone)